MCLLVHSDEAGSLVACTLIDFLGSVSTRDDQAFPPLGIGGLLTDVSGKVVTLNLPTERQRKSFCRLKPSNCTRISRGNGMRGGFRKAHYPPSLGNRRVLKLRFFRLSAVYKLTFDARQLLIGMLRAFYFY